MITLSGLYIYPIKSLQGISLKQSAFEGRGLRHDRRMMLVDPQGRFLSLRECPSMAQFRVEMSAETLTVRDLQGDSLELPLQPDSGPERGSEFGLVRPVQVWRSVSPAQGVSLQADAWFSARLGRPCHLVYQPPSARRETNPEYAPGHTVSFADGYPFLICSESSLADLAAAAGSALDMRAFRPNLVFSGAEAWAESGWSQLQVGGVTFQLVKPCVRCVIITQDPLTGAPLHPGLLKDLQHKQSWQGGPVFGVNAVSAAESGLLAVGTALIPSV